MTKRPLDHHRTSSAGALIARFRKAKLSFMEEGSHPSSRLLHRRATAHAGQRMPQYVRIDKGRRA